MKFGCGMLDGSEETGLLYRTRECDQRYCDIYGTRLKILSLMRDPIANLCAHES